MTAWYLIFVMINWDFCMCVCLCVMLMIPDAFKVNSLCGSIQPPFSQGRGGGAGAYPSCHWARRRVHPGQVVSPSQGHTEKNETNNHPCSHSLLGSILESVINLTCMFFGRWEEARVPGQNPHIHRENMQTPHRKAPAGIWTTNLLAVRWWC